jgi:hypothetical protein
MAIKDITLNDDFTVNSHFVFHSPYKIVGKAFDVSGNADFKTIAVHPIISIGVGEALMAVKMVVTVSFASAGAPTLVVTANSLTLTGSIAKAELAQGDIYNLMPNDALAATTSALGQLYAHTAAYTIDVETEDVSSAVWTAGRIMIWAEIADVAAMDAKFS